MGGEKREFEGEGDVWSGEKRTVCENHIIPQKPAGAVGSDRRDWDRWLHSVAAAAAAAVAELMFGGMVSLLNIHECTIIT